MVTGDGQCYLKVHAKPQIVQLCIVVLWLVLIWKVFFWWSFFVSYKKSYPHTSDCFIYGVVKLGSFDTCTTFLFDTATACKWHYVTIMWQSCDCCIKNLSRYCTYHWFCGYEIVSLRLSGRQMVSPSCGGTSHSKSIVVTCYWVSPTMSWYSKQFLLVQGINGLWEPQCPGMVLSLVWEAAVVFAAFPAFWSTKLV